MLSAVLVCVLAVARVSPAHGSHPFSPLNVWPNLELGGTQHIRYSICSASLPATVSAGIENKWDNIYSRWDFDLISGCNEATKVDWEGARGSCEGLTGDPYAVGCWIGYWVPRGNQVALTSALILFDVNHPDGHQFSTWGPNWQTEISAHEWGHNLGLADHDGTQCIEEP